MASEKDEGVFLPKWYLILNSHYFQYNQKLPTFLMVILMVVLYSIYGLFLLVIKNDITSILIGIVVIVIALGFLYLTWCYKIKPHKMSNIDIFALLLYRTGLDLKINMLDKKIGNKLTLDITLLKKRIKKNIKEFKGQQPKINALEKLRNNLKKISTINDSEKNLLSNKLFLIGETTFKDQTINENVTTELTDVLALKTVISYKEVAKNLQQFFTEHFTFLCIIIIALSAIVAYVIPSYKVEFFIAMLASVIGAWLFKNFS